MELIDSHAHLNAVANVDQSVAAARAAGVAQIVAVGMDLASNRKTLELAARFPGIVCPALGYHPWSIRPERLRATLAHLETHLPQCVAMGEIGLDYKLKLKKRIQWDVFERLLDLARQMGKPVIVHTRFAFARAQRMVAESGVGAAVFHWYSGPLDILERILADGYYISATPALAYSPAHRAAVAHAPLQRLLIETDAPVAYQGQVSTPRDVCATLEELSLLKATPRTETARITTANARSFFNLRRETDDRSG